MFCDRIPFPISIMCINFQNLKLEFLDLASRVKVFIWFFMSEGWFFIILRILSSVEEDRSKDEDGFVIRYTHKRGGITMVLMAGGFLER